MYFTADEERQLKSFLMEKLEPICDADPDVLADYVIALLKHEKSTAELRSLLSASLSEFLRNDTDGFTDTVLEHLSHKSSSARGPSSSSREDPEPQQIPTHSDDRRDVDLIDHSDDEDNSDRNFKHRKHSSSQSESRKHGRSDDAGSSHGDASTGHKIPRVEEGSISVHTSKAHDQKRSYKDDGGFADGMDSGRPSRRGGYDSSSQRRDYDSGRPRNYGNSGPGFLGNNPGARGPWDGSNPGQWGVAPMQGYPIPVAEARFAAGGMMKNPRGGSRSAAGGRNGNFSERRRGRCHDYDEKGYCLRGDLCPYDHGADRIVVDDSAAMVRPQFNMYQSHPMGPVMNAPVPMAGGPMYGNVMFAPARPMDMYGAQGHPMAMPEGYDPERAALNAEPSSAMVVSGGEGPLREDSRGPSQRGRGRGGARMGRGGAKGSGYRAGGTSLTVENIPREFCNMDKINSYFKQFGSIVNINVMAHYHKAVVQFSQHSEANAAYNSPEPIFSNRFVKVYWSREERDDGGAEGSKFGAGPSSGQPQEPQELTEEQKQQQERIKAIAKLQQQKQELIQRQLDQQKALMEKLDKDKTLTPAARVEIMKTVKLLAESIKSMMNMSVAAPPRAAPTPAANKALMDEKERERLDRELDLLAQNKTPDASEPASTSGEATKPSTTPGVEVPPAQSPTAAAAASAPIAVYSGRGRGASFGWGGRGQSWMRGGGPGHAPVRHFNLDNRPTTLLVKGIPAGEHDGFKELYESFGPIESLSFLDEEKATALVRYKARKFAEIAYAYGSKLPSGGAVELAWQSNAANSAATSPTTTTDPLTEPADQPPEQDTPAPAETEAETGVPAESTLETHWNDEDEDEDDHQDRSWKR
ncbi:uncharacterized protein BJ171DRAFT_507226 [Polychytrium aggregatum]|uniref:uncharacterized protein n=1 Tax=Polychytrium aggregatum TaxID=110093 RepID=UPI0022FE8B6B|nr:uncharacterized protein BJ171DRAFT_507226 [Polychytrium aggregatum]KAI9203977.1 hypothetical protein BJ171DRAFT_507226 [Polychytrium aggregatum]